MAPGSPMSRSYSEGSGFRPGKREALGTNETWGWNGENRGIYVYLHCTRVRVHARTLKSVKAAKPPWNAQAAKPQSRKAAMERASRKAAKPQSCHGTRKPQSRKAAKPQSRQAAKPPSRRAASSATHAPPPAFIAAALPPPWIAEAAKPQSRKL